MGKNQCMHFKLYFPPWRVSCFHQAFQKMKRNPTEENVMPNPKYTNEQLFFISFAQVSAQMVHLLVCVIVQIIDVHLIYVCIYSHGTVINMEFLNNREMPTHFPFS